MVCKKCGKKLPDRAHYCDRCGAKQINNIKSQKTPAMENYDSYRKRKMKYELEKRRRKRKMRIALVWIILIAIVGAIGAGVYSYKFMMQNRSEALVSTTETDVPEATEETEQTEEFEETALEETSSPTSTPENSEYEVYIDRAYGFKCAYPIGFVTGSLANKNTRLSLIDETGDGEMLISYQKAGKTDTASTLMRSYVGGLGVDPDFNRAGENWYSVTFTRSGRINHRLGTINGDLMHVYYDFIYEQGSDKRSEYEEYIDYIDEFLKNQISKNKKKN